MERQLIVMRHAKSSWADSGMSDHERPLNERGMRDAPRVAVRLCELSWVPQCILSSDARRTRQTAKLMMSVWDDGIELELLNSLYLAGVVQLQSAMTDVSEEVESLLVLGHNPGWEKVVSGLTTTDIVMKTATAALLHAECESWSNAFDVEWQIDQVIYPRELV